jgi:hypothetical protein
MRKQSATLAGCLGFPQKRKSAFISQGDPGWNNSDPTRSATRDPKTLVEDGTLPGSDPAYPGPTPDGFEDFLPALREELIAFKKPVAYVQGDSHYFRAKTHRAAPAQHGLCLIEPSAPYG